jgi:hypothetical protein
MRHTVSNCWKRLARPVGAALLVLGLPAMAAAQAATTSAISGSVVGEQAQPLGGIQIVATNTATGATSGVLTRADGRYLLPGLQPGGPYRIEARGIGFQTAVEEGVTLALGQTARFDFALVPAAVAIAGIEVTTQRDALISRGRTGTGSVVSEEKIQRSPTITRDFTDFTRLVPQVSTNVPGTSAAGRNNRFNNIQIDGAVNNDLFGLAASGTPGGQAGARPITLEAIQEFQVVIAPFDVRQNGFTGAGINAITRSGRNDFFGTVSAFGRNESLVGRFTGFDGQLSPVVDDFQQSDIAFSLGGPIVRDRAFFFTAGEFSRRNAPLGVTPGVGTDITTAHTGQVRDWLSQFGYDPGGFEGATLRRDSDNFFGRLDFNINDRHRATLRHNYVSGYDDNLVRGRATFDLGNAGYIFNSTTNSTVAQLNSVLGRGMFNEFRVGYSTVRDNRQVTDAFPRVEVRFPQGTVRGGPDNFSGQNALDQDILEITNDLTFSLGAHSVTVGTNNEFFSFSNLFVRNPFGYYRFDSPVDLEANRPALFENSFLLPGGRERAEFPARRLGVYAQNRWQATDNLTLTMGLRADLHQLPETPALNPEVTTALAGIGVDRRTDQVPNNVWLFNPRLGFNWDVQGDGATQLRGGVGTFSGRTPFVWISNAYGNTGLDFVRFTCSGGTGVPAFTADPANQPRSCRPGTAAPLAPNEIKLVDPNFKFPQVFRASLAVDRRLPLGLVGTLEGLYTGTISDVLYQDLLVSGPTGVTVEGRPQYGRHNVPGLSNVIDMTNTSEGHSYSITTQLQRPFAGGWDFSAAYTFSAAEDVNPVTSSQAISNWRFNISPLDPNNPPAARSNFDIPHRVLLTASLERAFLRNSPTNLSFIFVGESGQPYSYRYNNDLRGDGSFGNDPLYVPANQGEIRFRQETVSGQVITPQMSWDNLNAFIEATPCLRENRGQVLTRNACRQPWSNRIDVRVAQSLGTIGNQRAQITMDILNFGNLLNNEWGRVQTAPQTDALLTVRNRNPNAEGRAEMGAFVRSPEPFGIANLSSRYQVQLGLRYMF